MADCSCIELPSSMTMSRMSRHAKGSEADAGCDQEVNASECCPVDAESRTVCSREIVAPGPTVEGSSPNGCSTVAGRDTGALVRVGTGVLPSGSVAKTLALLTVEGIACPGT